MFNNILIPLDGSENSEKIIWWAEGLAKAFDSEIVLLTVVDPDDVVRHPTGLGRDRPDRDARPQDLPGGISSLSSGVPLAGVYPIEGEPSGEDSAPGFGTQVIEQIAHNSNSYVNELASSLAAKGIKNRAMVTIGSPADEIIRVACEEDIDLITMATHRESALVRGVLGSVTDRVVRTSVVPVMTIRPELEIDSGQWTPQVVLVPLDGSELSEIAVPVAIEIALKMSASIAFARVTTTSVSTAIAGDGTYFDGPLSFEKQSNFVYEYLEPFEDSARGRGLSTSIYSPTGNVVGNLTAIADEIAETLIVMSTHGASGLRRLILGSVADKVIRSAGHPVMIVPGALEQ